MNKSDISVLIVDDLLSIHEMLDAVIQPTGFATAFATDGEKALDLPGAVPAVREPVRAGDREFDVSNPRRQLR